IIVRGKNHAPEDLEDVIAVATGVGGGALATAVFSVGENDGEEEVVVVVEIDDPALGLEAAAEQIRRALFAHDELSTRELIFVKKGAIPRTTSGKIQRYACRQAYLAGALPSVLVSKSVAQAALGSSQTLTRPKLLGARPEERLSMLEEHVLAEVADALG